MPDRLKEIQQRVHNGREVLNWRDDVDYLLRLLEAQGFDHAMKQTASKQREALRYIGSRQRITCVATGEYVEWEYAECGFVGKYEWVERLNTIKKPHPLDESETKVNA